MGRGSNGRWGRGSFLCYGLLNGSQWCFSMVVFLSSGGLLGCLLGLGGVVGCAGGLRPLIVGLWWLGC